MIRESVDLLGIEVRSAAHRSHPVHSDFSLGCELAWS